MRITRRIPITTTDSFQLRSFLKGYCCQFGTTYECRSFNCFYTGGYFNRGYRTIRKSAIIIRIRRIRKIITTTDSSQFRTFLKSYSCQLGATLECRGFNCFYTGRNLNRSYRAIRESTIIIRIIRITTTDSFQLTFLKSHCFQRATTLECRGFNRFYTRWDFNRGQ